MQDLDDVILETSRYIGETERHYLVFEVAVLSPESRFLFIVLFYSYRIVNTCKIELGKLFGLI